MSMSMSMSVFQKEVLRPSRGQHVWAVAQE